MRLRKDLTGQGLDAGPRTIAWHLRQHHDVGVSEATISRYLSAHQLVVPEPKKKPKSAFVRFAADQPNERWQADFTHYRLTDPDGTPAPTPRSCPGSMTTPVTPWQSPPSTGSPDPSCSPPSALLSPRTAPPPRR